MTEMPEIPEMTEMPEPNSRPDPAVFPGVPDDDLVLALPSSPSPDDPAGIGSLAYAIHTDNLASTREHPSRGVNLDSGTIELFRAALRLTGSLNMPDALRHLVESACSITGAAWGTIGVLGTTGSPSLATARATASPSELDSMLTGARR